MKSTIKKVSKNNKEMVEIIEKKRNKKINIESSEEEVDEEKTESESEDSVIEKPKRKVNYVLTEAHKNNIIKMQKARSENIQARKEEKNK